MSNIFYVYILRNPLKENIPFYVGKGKDRRCFQHLKDGKHKNKHKYNTIKQIRKKVKREKVLPKIFSYYGIHQRKINL